MYQYMAFYSFQDILICIATPNPHIACLVAGSFQVCGTCPESCSWSLPFSGVCMLASLSMYKLSNNQEPSILEVGIWDHLKKFT